jgi:hypothetical protein
MSQQSDFNIYPNITITKRIVAGRLSVCDYIPFESAKIAVMLKDENGICVENRIYTLDASNGFNEWGSNDNFLIAWVKNKLSS